jgi:oligopeptide transport system substrate-binding protein
LLREGLCFSDGTPIAAEDFLRSWRRAADPATGSPYAEVVAKVAAAARSLDERTIEIAFDAPRPDLLEVLTLPAFYPVPREAIERFGEGWTRAGRLVSNGPFRLAAWEVGRRLRLARNESYHGAGRVSLATIDALTTSGAAVGEGTAFAIYETGGADLVFSAPAAAAERLRGRADLHVGPALRTIFVRFNLRRRVLADRALRRALSATIDREGICGRVLRGGERPARSLVPPAFPGFEDGGAARAGPASAEEIEAVRARAGEIGQIEIVYASADESAGHAAEVLQAGWRARLGVDVRLRPMERKAFYAAVRAGEYDVAWGNWVADWPDPANFLEIMRERGGNNRTGFGDARYEALLDEATAASGTRERGRALAAADALLWEEAPIAPIAFGANAVFCRPRVRGFTANALNLVAWGDLSVASTP